MILYHFCPAHLKAAILQSGLTLGKFPLIGDGHYSAIENCQWPTLEKGPDKQSWATQRLISYSRTDFRLTVRVPESFRKKLIRADDFVQSLSPEQRRIVTDWPGHEKWYIYKGRVPAKWIVGCRKMKEGV